MNDLVTELFGNIDEEKFKDFDYKTNSKVNHLRKTKTVSRDFSWIPIVEETLPYIDTIIRNPKRFIVQEEDIVIVEKSKKISTETVEHLAQHTNFIQDIDDKGMIKPSKVLNVQKEETWDIYENRFIYTLVKELAKFITKYTDRDLEDPHIDISNQVEYEGNTSYENENIKLSVNLETRKITEPENFNKEEMLAKIESIRDIVYGFEKSEFIKSLSQAVPVKSPIKKTNIILKEPNFQKAVVLWEYLKNSEIAEPEEKSNQEEDLSTHQLKRQFDLAYFLEYLGINNIENDTEISPDLLEEKIISLLEEYMDITNISEKKLLEQLSKEIKSAIKKRTIKYNDILKIYNKFFKAHTSYLNNVCDIIDI